MMVRAHVFIYGDVIGVSFRAWTQRRAKELELTGWVRNASGKTVEAVFEGSKEKVEEMIKLCNEGPEVSWIERVDYRWEEAKGEFLNFDISI